MDIYGCVDKTFNGPDMVDPVGEDTFSAAPSAKVQMPWVHAEAQVEGTSTSSSHAHASPEKSIDTHQVCRGVQWSQCISVRATLELVLNRHITATSRAMIKRKTVDRSDCKCNHDFAFKISVSAALRDRGDEARLVIMAELQQKSSKSL